MGPGQEESGSPRRKLEGKPAMAVTTVAQGTRLLQEHRLMDKVVFWLASLPQPGLQALPGSLELSMTLG